MNFSILNSKYLNNNQIDSNNNYNYFQSNYNMYNNKYPWHRIGDSTSLENIYLSKCYQKTMNQPVLTYLILAQVQHKCCYKN